jgi:hypothetical protein
MFIAFIMRAVLDAVSIYETSVTLYETTWRSIPVVSGVIYIEMWFCYPDIILERLKKLTKKSENSL